MKIEIVRTPGGLWSYLDIFAFSFPDDSQDENLTKVTLTICEESFEYYAFRLHGWQRLLLSQETTDVIIDALIEGNDVIITSGMHQMIVPSSGFSKQFQRILNIRMSQKKIQKKIP